MNKNLLIGIGVFLVVAVAGFFLLGKPQKNTPTEATLVPGGSTAGEVKVEGNVHEVTISGSEFSFSPSNLTLTKGEKVRLTFTNNGNVPHNLVIDKLGISTKTIGKGESDTVEFTVNESGTFIFYCSVPSHKDKGMEGTLVVE